MPPKPVHKPTKPDDPSEPPNKKGKINPEIICEWFLTVDRSSGTEFQTVTGLKSGSIFTTEPITDVIDYVDMGQTQPQTIICGKKQKKQYVLEDPLEGKFTTKVIDAMGPWGAPVIGGQDVHKQVTHHLKPTCIEAKDRYSKGINGECENLMKLQGQHYQMLLLSNALGCRSKLVSLIKAASKSSGVKKTAKAAEAELEENLKDDATINEFCERLDVPLAFVKALQEVDSNYEQLKESLKKCHGIIYFKDSTDGQVQAATEELKAAYERGGVAKQVVDRKSLFLDCCEQRAARVQEQNAAKKAAESGAKTKAEKDALQRRLAEEECESLRDQIENVRRSLNILRTRDAELGVQERALIAELAEANGKMEEALKARGTIRMAPLAAAMDRIVANQQSLRMDRIAIANRIDDEASVLRDLETKLAAQERLCA